ncbi:transposase family protein [Streptomyces sp. NPDC048462]|uniref:transposase family protein n=1 Tax=Streptomyces sp. NPDC048462 TaxID=3365555 RepID=UPI003714DDC5
MVARGRATGSGCQDCGCFSDRVHDRYQRRLKDLPLAEQGFVIQLTVRRFICGSVDCPRRTFAESFPRLAAPHTRFTRRLNHALEQVGLVLAGRAGARLDHPTSHGPDRGGPGRSEGRPGPLSRTEHSCGTRPRLRRDTHRPPRHHAPHLDRRSRCQPAARAHRIRTPSAPRPRRRGCRAHSGLERGQYRGRCEPNPRRTP